MNELAQPIKSLEDRCRAIELLVLDVDGVLTDGRIVYDSTGVEHKSFHVRDGYALKCWHEAGKRSAILSGRASPAVEVRAREIGISRILQGADDKLAAFQRLLGEWRLAPEQACFVADDLPDLQVFSACGLAVAVADACPELRWQAHYVTATCGGEGAAREAIERILRCQGKWNGP